MTKINLDKWDCLIINDALNILLNLGYETEEGEKKIKRLIKMMRRFGPSRKPKKRDK